MLVILGSLLLPFASRMASQAKEVEMLSTEELQRNQQLISKIYTLQPVSPDHCFAFLHDWKNRQGMISNLLHKSYPIRVSKSVTRMSQSSVFYVLTTSDVGTVLKEKREHQFSG